MLPVRLVAPREHRRALEPVAVLVRVGGDRRHAGQPEIEHRDVRVTEFLAPRQDPAAEAAVDVQARALLEHHVRQRRDRVDGAVRIVARGRDDHRGVRRDRVAHEIHVHLRRHRVGRRDDHLHAEHVRGLVERRVGRLRPDHFRLCDAALDARPVAVGEDRVLDALRAAGPDGAAGLLRRIMLLDRLAVQHRERHRDDLALEATHARADVALQRVDVAEVAERLVQERVVLVIPAVHRAGALAALPFAVLALGHRAHLLEDRRLVEPLFRETGGPRRTPRHRGRARESLSRHPSFVSWRLSPSADGRVMISSAAACSRAFAAAMTVPPCSGEFPCRSVTTPPAPSMIGISGTMSYGISMLSTIRSMPPCATSANP